MELRFRGIGTHEVHGFRAGAKDANGQRPLVQKGAGLGPCRHCLELLREPDEKIVLAYRPFGKVHPYSEIGPIFLHASDCPRYDAPEPPAWFDHLEPAIVRGYGQDDWIRYDTGAVIPGKHVAEAARAILGDASIAYVHVRSKFGCLQCRVDRT